MQHLRLFEERGEAWVIVENVPPHALSLRGLRRARSADRSPAAEVVILLAPPRIGLCAALALVPVGLDDLVTIDGIAVRAGMHALPHGAEIAFGRRRVLVALEPEADEMPYDPLLHGEELACFRTRRSFTPGEVIVLCPGSPGRPCGNAYARDVWSELLRCPSCGLVPSEEHWKPAPRRRAGARLDRILGPSRGH